MRTLKSMDWFCWENLQETIDFPMKFMGLSCNFSLQPLHWIQELGRTGGWGRKNSTVLGLAAGIWLRMGIYPPQIYDKRWGKIRINNGILVAPFSDKPRADFENLDRFQSTNPLGWKATRSILRFLYPKGTQKRIGLGAEGLLCSGPVWSNPPVTCLVDEVPTRCWLTPIWLVVLTILKNMKVNGKDYPYIYMYMENSKCLKPPTSYFLLLIFVFLPVFLQLLSFQPPSSSQLIYTSHSTLDSSRFMVYFVSPSNPSRQTIINLKPETIRNNTVSIYPLVN